MKESFLIKAKKNRKVLAQADLKLYCSLYTHHQQKSKFWENGRWNTWNHVFQSTAVSASPIKLYLKIYCSLYAHCQQKSKFWENGHWNTWNHVFQSTAVSASPIKFSASSIFLFFFSHNEAIWPFLFIHSFILSGLTLISRVWYWRFGVGVCSSGKINKFEIDKSNTTHGFYILYRAKKMQ